MTMTIWQGALTIVTVVLGTMCTRFLPFLVFPESKQPPRIIEYFGQVLPYAMTGLLVVYALRNTPILTGSHGLPELIACTVIVLLHVWKTQYAAFNRRQHNCIYVAGATGVLRHPTR